MSKIKCKCGNIISFNTENDYEFHMIRDIDLVKIEDETTYMSESSYEIVFDKIYSNSISAFRCIKCDRIYIKNKNDDSFRIYIVDRMYLYKIIILIIIIIMLLVIFVA